MNQPTCDPFVASTLGQSIPLPTFTHLPPVYWPGQNFSCLLAWSKLSPDWIIVNLNNLKITP